MKLSPLLCIWQYVTLENTKHLQTVEHYFIPTYPLPMTISIFYFVKELWSTRFPWRVAFAKVSVEAPVEARVEEYRSSLWNKSLSNVRHRSYLECQQNYVFWSLCLWWEWIFMLYIGRKRLKYDSLNAGHEFNNNFKMNGLCVPQQKLHSWINSLIRTRKRKKKQIQNNKQVHV